MELKYDIRFVKAEASGNDFLMIDNTDGALDPRKLDYSAMAKDLCRRHMSVGADGILVLEKSSKASFKMRIINSDGSEADMCGNGARCSLMYAFRKGMGASLDFETGAGILKGEVKGGKVKVKLTDPKDIRTAVKLDVDGKGYLAYHINTGVPHAVIIVEDLDNVPVKDVGRKIRFHEKFAPKGANVNFVMKPAANKSSLRTYERGVEDETSACGTGTVASAVTLGLLGYAVSPVKMLTRGGEELVVYFDIKGEGAVNVYLEGTANLVYEGRV
jgi:diaminopimelate epimerase